MASKSKSKSKGLGSDSSLGKMGQRMINTMLREERVAERDLQEKLKAISEKEHKTMVKLGCDSLDVRHDLTLHQSSASSMENTNNTSDLGHETRPRLGRKAVSMLAYPNQQETRSTHTTDLRRSVSEEAQNNKSSTKSPTIIIDKHEEIPKSDGLEGNEKKLDRNEGIQPRSPRLLQRRPVSDISAYSPSQQPSSDKDILIHRITRGKGLTNDGYHIPKAPSTPPPSRKNLSADPRNQRPLSARVSRQKTANRGLDGQRSDLSMKHTRSPSPSPVRLSADGPMNLPRRGSAPPKIDANVLPVNSPLRRSLCTSDVCLSPSSPDALRKRLSQTDEDLQDRVSVFLKTLAKK